MTIKEIIDQGAAIGLFHQGELNETTVMALYTRRTQRKFAWYDLVAGREHLFRDVIYAQEHDLAWWIISQGEKVAYITPCSEQDEQHEKAFKELWTNQPDTHRSIIEASSKASMRSQPMRKKTDMWICSKHGFYSIVRKEEAWHVRARKRQDLENLVARAGLEYEDIQEWPFADYRWRILVEGADLARVFGFLLESIDYSNFKAQISSDPGQREKAGAYGRFWGDMLGIQANAEEVQRV